MVVGSISGEIIALPYAIYHMGIYLSITTLVITAFLSHISSMMYLKVKDLAPLHLQSSYELAYLLVGRWAVYLVCIVQYFLNYGTIVLYYSIIGDTVAHLFAGALVPHLAIKSIDETKEMIKIEPIGTQIVAHRATTIVFVGLALCFVVFMRQLHELKEFTSVFMAFLLAFLVFFYIELFVNGGNITLTLAEISQVKVDHKLITSFIIIVYSYNVQYIVFNAYFELKSRSNARFARASIISSVFEIMVYLSIGLASILMFGPEEIKPDILDNIGMRPGAVSVVVRVVFCLLLFFNVPFLFFLTRE